MRLFFAVQLDDQTKDRILSFANTVKKNSVSGNFSHRDNLHITLVFLGEVSAERLPIIKNALDSLPFSPFSVHLSHFGKFKNRGTSTYWIGAEDCKPLNESYRFLNQTLTKQGFMFEQREFKPHLTIGREVVLCDGIEDELKIKSPNIAFEVTRISLMNSERIAGKLTYTELHHKSSERNSI